MNGTVFNPLVPKHRAALRREIDGRLARLRRIGAQILPSDLRQLAMLNVLDAMLTKPTRRRGRGQGVKG